MLTFIIIIVMYLRQHVWQSCLSLELCALNMKSTDTQLLYCPFKHLYLKSKIYTMTRETNQKKF